LKNGISIDKDLAKAISPSFCVHVSLESELAGSVALIKAVARSP
jgi:hypothetical protein